MVYFIISKESYKKITKTSKILTVENNQRWVYPSLYVDSNHSKKNSDILITVVLSETSMTTIILVSYLF